MLIPAIRNGPFGLDRAGRITIGMARPPAEPTMAPLTTRRLQEHAMRQTVCTMIAIATFAVGGMAEDKHGKPKVKVVSERDVVETVNGKKAKAVTVEVTLEPGDASMPHRHPGPVFGYVLE